MLIDFDDAGSGPAVALLHSSVADRRMWDPQWSVLGAIGLRVVRVDFRGHGSTPAPTSPFNAACDVVAVLDECGIDQVSLIGSSYGGRVAQEVAARWPERVGVLQLWCAATRLHPPTPDIIAFSAREDALLAAGDVIGAATLNVDTFLGPRATEATRAAVTAMQRHTFDVQRAAEDAAQSRDSDFARNADFDLGAVTARTLVVSGGHDVDYFQQTADALTTAIPGAHRVHLDWAGHLPTLEDPATANELLLAHLAGTVGA